MCWSIPSTKRVNPTTHIGQLVTTIRRADRATSSPATGGAGDRSGVCRASAVLTTGPPPVARGTPRLGPQAPGV
jgi:hypothetical protein